MQSEPELGLARPVLTPPDGDHPATVPADSMSKQQGQARRFKVVLIKPSHYDDDGYVIRWYRSPMPANSLASVYGLIADCARREVLGSDVAIDISAIDETNTRVRVDRSSPTCAAMETLASSVWSACNPISIRARSISRACCGPPGCR